MQLHCKQKGQLSTPFLLQCSSPCHAGNAHAVSTNSAVRCSGFKTKATTLCFLQQVFLCAFALHHSSWCLPLPFVEAPMRCIQAAQPEMLGYAVHTSSTVRDAAGICCAYKQHSQRCCWDMLCIQKQRSQRCCWDMLCIQKQRSQRCCWDMLCIQKQRSQRCCWDMLCIQKQRSQRCCWDMLCVQTAQPEMLG